MNVETQLFGVHRHHLESESHCHPRESESHRHPREREDSVIYHIINIFIIFLDSRFRGNDGLFSRE